ncbi:MAG: LPS assembly protein LptD [Ignavibacteriaceae bacterium]
MKKIIFICLVFSISALVYAQNINGRFSSSLYSFERFDTSDVSQTHLRTYQMLNLNLNYENFSVRSYLNLEHDFAKEMIDDPRLRFYNLYLEARNILELATFKLGRQPLFNSVAGGIYDGASLVLKKYDFQLSGFYGANVPAYQKLELIENWEDNYVLGGKLSTSALDNFRFAIGYINKNFKPMDYLAQRLDPSLNPIQVLIESKSNQYEFLSGEASFYMKDLVSIDTRYDYDINYSQTSKIEADARYEQIEDLGINVYYNFREPRIRYNSIFSVFDFGNSQEIELGGDYRIDENFTVIGKFGYVTYKDDNSSRAGLGVATKYGSLNYRKTFGYAGEMDALSLYSAYSFLDGLFTPSLGISFTNYKLSSTDEANDLISLLAGINYRPMRALSFDLQAQFMNNKIYKNDLRLLFKLNHWFNLNL